MDMEEMDCIKMESALFAGETDLRQTDPEFSEFFSRFAFQEVPQSVAVDGADAWLGVLAALIGCQCLAVFRRLVSAVVSGPLAHIGLTPVQLRETVYQATAYLGIGRTLPFMETLNAVFLDAGLGLPLEAAHSGDGSDRLEAGQAKQMEIFGPQMEGFASSGPEGSRHINKWLVDNCFGDYYVRPGLSTGQREMVTFCFLAAQGGCEPQLQAHTAANLRVGNDGSYLIGIVSACLPYIGYPRALNALRCVEEAQKNQNGLHTGGRK